jgi:tetratricopeptide (TPR) repeat protein
MTTTLVLVVAIAVLLSACAAAPAPAPQSLPVIRTLWNFQDPAGTEAKFREILPAARASGDRAYLAELLSQIARTQGLQLRFEEADATLAEAETFLGDGMPRSRVLCLLERGRVRNSSKRQEESKPYFLKAWDEARAAGLGGLAVDAAHMMAIACMPDGSLEWNLKAIAFAEASEDPAAKAWLGSLYNNTGWDHHNAGRYEEALALFRKNQAFEEARKTGSYDARVARWTVARALRSLGRTEEALAAQVALQAESEAAGDPDGYGFEEIAECLWTLGREDEAKPFFAKAWELLSKDPWLQRDEPKRLERMRLLADGAPE